MNAQVMAIAASLALAIAASAYSQTSPNTSGFSGQGKQSSSSQESQKQQIDQQQKAAMDKCNGMPGNAKDICKAEVDGQKQVTEAQQKMTANPSPKTQLELADAKSKAQYNVA
jgi:hypothetical protein